jgi:hypothetical protein
MPETSPKPLIFISYSHKDEPNPAGPGEDAWLSYVQSFLQPAMKYAAFELWTDEDIPGGDEWKEHIRAKLAVCDICILLVSRHSLNSHYCIDIEVETIRQRQRREPVHIYPIMLTPVPRTALAPIRHLNLKPKNGKPLSAFEKPDRDAAMSAIADEIAAMLGKKPEDATPPPIGARLRFDVAADSSPAPCGEGKGRPSWVGVEPSDTTVPHGTTPHPVPPPQGGRESARLPFVNLAPMTPPPPQLLRPPSIVHITGLPETAYERLVGRDAELERLDTAWADRNTNIISLVAEGGAGKSALVNEWLKRMQADNYRGAEVVLGWSFYSQGSKERATSAEPFLNWALGRLGIKIETTSATAKGEAIAEALARRRVLLVLDGVEPLQHGLGTQQGELKDLGLRALLRRLAAMPPTEAHGLVVLTSRLAVKDIARWKDGAAPVLDVEQLSDEAGAALLRDNGVWGTDRELRAAARAFGGHPLALGLLASFLKETQFGDVRRRDHIRELLDDPENPRHDHARRVMESYDTEWLAGQPVPHAIMHMVGLFDRPASGDRLAALRRKPAIPGLTDAIVNLDEGGWRRAITRLRDVRLLVPKDPRAPDALDAHPLVREWFGRRLEETNPEAWRAAHGRLYEHLRDTTREGRTPTLEALAPLYQAIPHGCRAGRHQAALDNIYKDRICRRRADRQIEYYSFGMLGAYGSDLAAMSWFFEKPYGTPATALTAEARSWVLGCAAHALRARGRLGEALAADRAGLRMDKEAKDWSNAAVSASNLSQAETLVGEVAVAVATAEQSVEYADKSGNEFLMLLVRATHADALHAAGRPEEAERLFADAERRHKARHPANPLLYSLQGSLLQNCRARRVGDIYEVNRTRHV